MYRALLAYIVDKAASAFHIDLDPRTVATDFEQASINAFREIFPNVIMTGCHFHLGQSVIRRVNEMGLKAMYRSDDEFALHVRMLYALAYLPVDDVPAALEVIRGSMPAAGQPLMEYFDRTYVNGPVIRRTAADLPVHRLPLFPPSFWNVADRFASNLPTTTNHVEAWHRRLQTIIVVDHPSFYTCLHKLRQEQRHTEIAILRGENGFRPKHQRRSMTEHFRRLKTLTGDLRTGRKTTSECLRGIAHALGGHKSLANLEADAAVDGSDSRDVVAEVEEEDTGEGEGGQIADEEIRDPTSHTVSSIEVCGIRHLLVIDLFHTQNFSYAGCVCSSMSICDVAIDYRQRL